MDDLEARKISQLHVGVGESETHMATLRPHASSDTSTASLLSNGQGVETQPIISQAEVSEGIIMPEINTAQPQRDNANGVEPTRAGDDTIEDGVQAVANDSGPGTDGTSDREPNKDRNGDGSSTGLRTPFGTEAKNHDNARINSLNYNTDRVRIFSGLLFSAIIVPLLVDSLENLKAKPHDEMVYYLRQNSEMILSQILLQQSSTAPQVSVPSAPLPPFPPFSPKASDVLIASLYALSLGISLSLALFASLYLQCVGRNGHASRETSGIAPGGECGKRTRGPKR